MQIKENSLLPGQRLRARGAGSNDSGRFEGTSRIAYDDGWDIPHSETLVQTDIRLERPRSALNYVTSPDLPLTARSTPIAAANTAASIASPARPMPI